MAPLASTSGVAISGMVYTANLGITRIVQNVTSNPAIRFLLICGRDSALFHPGQSIAALSDNGVDNNRRIVGASGYDPVLKTLAGEQIAQFRKQVELVDWTGEEDIETIKTKIQELSSRNPGRFSSEAPTNTSPMPEKFATIRPGGQREPLVYDPKGYFVITVEPAVGEIVLRHYLPDHSPAHEMRGRGATSMLLGLLHEGLVTQLSHAGYLGEELAKAQTALQFGLRYDQDRPLRRREVSPATEARESPSRLEKLEPASAKGQQEAANKPVPRPFNLEQFEGAQSGQMVDCVITVTDLPHEWSFQGFFLEMDEAEPFLAYKRTNHTVEGIWKPTTRIIMGKSEEVVVGAMLRILGRKEQSEVHAEQIIILTRAARIIS
jgi:tetrahydromethanopterin S-methyltransferase subunit A